MFYATISDKFMSKATRLFNSSNMDIFHELIQNARRAGAGTVHINYDNNNKRYILWDNGKGVEKAADLLTLGESNWDSETQRKEDPAGMGIFSLASRPCRIASRDWYVDLTPDHFAGQLEITPMPQGRIEGTVISFDAEEETYNYELKDELKYYPLLILINGEILETKPFIDPSLPSTEYKGLKIQLFKERNYARSSEVNFHGLTLNHSFSLPGKEHWFNIDVDDCPELELVLPARKELIQNEFLKDLSIHLRKLVFEYYLNEPHNFKFSEYTEAQELGIELDEAIPQLKSLADRELRYLEDLRNPAFLYGADECDEITLFNHQSPHQVDFVMSNSSMRGYSWYDALPLHNVEEFDTENFKVTFEDSDLVLTFDYMFKREFYSIEDLDIFVKDTKKTSRGDLDRRIEASLHTSFMDSEGNDHEGDYYAYFDEAVACLLDKIYDKDW